MQKGEENIPSIIVIIDKRNTLIANFLRRDSSKGQNDQKIIQFYAEQPGNFRFPS